MLILSGDPALDSNRRLAETVDDSGLVHIVGRHLQLHTIARRQPDETLAHLSGNVREHGVIVRQLHAEHRSREHGCDLAFQFNCLFRIHSLIARHAADTAAMSRARDLLRL